MNYRAPLVRSRTLEVDFRFLAMPKDMDEESRKWIELRVASSMVYAEKLREHQRWVFLKKNRYTVVAVICENRALANAAAMQVDTKDFKSREIYLFAGYVFKDLPPGNYALPMRMEIFAGLLVYVQKHWTERDSALPKSEEERLRLIAEDFFEDEFSKSPTESLPGPPASVSFNTSPDCIKIYPVDRSETLWASAFSSDAPELSLCLGMPNAKYAKDSRFGNVTIEGITREELLLKEPAPTSIESVNSNISYEDWELRKAHKAYRGTQKLAGSPPIENKPPGVVAPLKSKDEKTWKRAQVGPVHLASPQNEGGQTPQSWLSRLWDELRGKPGGAVSPAKLPDAQTTLTAENRSKRGPDE